GPKILVEWSQVETGRAVQDLRHGVRAKVGHGIRTLLCPRATRAKSQYKVGLSGLHPRSPTRPRDGVGFAGLGPTCERAGAGHGNAICLMLADSHRKIIQRLELVIG